MNPSKLILATQNNGKKNEFQKLFVGTGIEIIMPSGLEEVEETGKTFTENAILKVDSASGYPPPQPSPSRGEGVTAELASRVDVANAVYPIIADDSGLVIPALDGNPGIYSARWAEKNGVRDFPYAMQKIKDELDARNVPQENRTAYFVCLLAIKYPDGTTQTFEGKAHGHLKFPPKGENNFGYDPIFSPNGYDITFAEMERAEKNALSHRAKAVAKLLASWKNAE